MIPAPFPSNIKTPCFFVDLSLLRKNLDILEEVRKRGNVKILLAQKAFSMFSVYPLCREKLDGTCASSPHEARLGREEFGKEVTSFAAAYSQEDVKELIQYSNHIIFNSLSQLERFREMIPPHISIGIRINPEHSEVEEAIYDPCSPDSRLGIRRKALGDHLPEGVTGLHIHNLCEKNADAFQRTLAQVEKEFAPLLAEAKWINFGGGHHITREDYDKELLIDLLLKFRQKWGGKELFLEPGEAIALNTGFLAATVLDIVEASGKIAILDTSAEAHMPDVLEMPYRPFVIGSDFPGKKPFSYTFAGHSCLAGDVIGKYSFDRELQVGDKLYFTDMAHYTMVKTNTFNGLQLPSIALWEPERNEFTVVREFGYEDFKGRLS